MDPDESANSPPFSADGETSLREEGEDDRHLSRETHRTPSVDVLPGDVVRVHALELRSPEASTFLRPLTPAERIERTETALEIGFLCLQRAAAHSDLEFVRRNIEALLTEVGRHVGDIPRNLEGVLADRLGAEKGPVLAPILSSVDRAQGLINQRMLEVHRLLSEDIDPSKETSTIARALRSIRELLDPASPGSVQAAMQEALQGLEAADGPLGRIRAMLDPEHERSIQKTLASSVDAVTQKDGELLRTVKTVVAEAMDPLAKSVDRLSLAVKKEEGAEEEYLAGTGGGHAFEELVAARLAQWARETGAEVEHVGPDNEPGDVVVTVPGVFPGQPTVRLVVEAKADSAGRGHHRLKGDLEAAMKRRKADAAVFVGETPASLARELRQWGEGKVGDAPYVATLGEDTVSAVRYIVALKRLEHHAQGRGREISDLSGELTTLRASLKHLANISTQCDALDKARDKVLAEADEMRKEVHGALRQIEEKLQSRP